MEVIENNFVILVNNAVCDMLGGCNGNIKVAFFGSSDFSIPTLKKLLNTSNFDVVAVITAPAVRKNRGKKIANNVVYDFAVNNGIDVDSVFTPNRLKKNQEIVDILKHKNTDFIVVVSYGKIIPKSIIEVPRYEIINLHPSALPRFRGAAPIERAIESGDEEIEICIMKVDEGLDTGDVLMRKKYILGSQKHASEIIPDIAEIGAGLIIEVIDGIKSNTLHFEKQSEDGVVYASKIEKTELFIDINDFSQDAKKIFNKIRAFNNSGCCYFMLNGQRVKIVSASLIMKENNNVGMENCGFNIHTGEIVFQNGIIKPIILQKEGKRPVELKAFLNGLR